MSTFSQRAGKRQIVVQRDAMARKPPKAHTTHASPPTQANNATRPIDGNFPTRPSTAGQEVVAASVMQVLAASVKISAGYSV